jgi:hypothetical protein
MTAAWLDRVRQHLPGLGWPEGVQRHARVVQALPLGPGSRLLVVEFAGRHLLVGQSRSGLVRLAEGDAP